MNEACPVHVPMSSERCLYKGCYETARYQLGFTFWADRALHPDSSPLRAMTGMGLCAEHVETATAAECCSDQVWRLVEASCRAIGKVIPERRLTELRFELIRGSEA